jgi:hypothetical protein
MADINQVATKTSPLRVERHWIGGKMMDLDVCQIPIEHLYFNIENGRYADRMLRLKHENAGKEIDPRQEEWKEKIERMLAGEHKDTSADKAAFDKLIDDINNRTQLRPGVVTIDGGVIDGNRRLAALRRLNHETREKFRTFDGVILPKNTTPEDRWRIEAGLQLGINERWDYSPINELLKVRDGVRLYEEMIRRGKLKKDADPIQLVSKAIYGRSETQIREMVSRLDLIDEYLRFVKRPEAYDEIGAVSERFLEATRIIQAAENGQRDPEFLTKLKAVLFYVIDRGEMKNWDLRKIYDALGGDPRKRGPKRVANEGALTHYLKQFPDARDIQTGLLQDRDDQVEEPSAQPTAKPKVEKPAKPQKAPVEAKPPINKAKVAAATQQFLTTMETQAKPPRSIAAGALGQIETLHEELGKKAVREAMTVDDKAEVKEAVESMKKRLDECLGWLKKV